MTAINYQAYFSDINQLLKYANEHYLPAITAAVSQFSEYDQALSEADRNRRGGQFEKDKLTIEGNTIVTPDLRVGRTYRFKRQLVGAQVGSYHYGESLVRRMSLRDGDIVKFKSGNQVPPELELIQRNELDDSRKIVRKKVIVERHQQGELVVRRLHDGKPILEGGKPVTIRLNPNDVRRDNVQVNDVIEVAYYVDQGSGQARISWIYRNENNQTVKPEPKPHSAYTTHKAKSTDVFTPKIAFDLTDKTVLMAGYAAHRKEAAALVKAHHGKLIVFDHTSSGKGKGIESNLATAVKHADIVIVMLHAVSHETANKAIAHAKDFHKLVATSNINSPLSIEDAIKRALNREPVYQQSSHVVE